MFANFFPTNQTRICHKHPQGPRLHQQKQDQQQPNDKANNPSNQTIPYIRVAIGHAHPNAEPTFDHKGKAPQKTAAKRKRPGRMAKKSCVPLPSPALGFQKASKMVLFFFF